MKRIIASVTLLLCLAVYSLNSFAGSIAFDVDKAENGVIGITYHGQEGNRYKVMISKDSEEYTYDYFGEGKEYFPLQSGSGDYKVSVLENISGTSYKVIQSKKMNVDLASDNIVFLQSVQNVNWNIDMEAISTAKALVGETSTTEDKLEAIYEYIVANIDYDYLKMNSLDKQYVPDVENTLKTKKGICYDYAALLASMLRSQGIPAKLVKGYSDNVDGYHAWNEVYIKNEWITIDTTYDAVLGSIGEKAEMGKDKSEYQTLKIY